MTYSTPKYQTALALALGALIHQSVSAETLTGWINGHDCATLHHVCPIDKLDPHVQLESDFVLVVGDEHYFLTNLSRDLKVRYVLDKVMVVGEVSNKHNSVDVSEFRVRAGNGYKTVWSKAMVTAERQRLCREAKSNYARYGDSVYNQSQAYKLIRKHCASS